MPAGVDCLKYAVNRSSPGEWSPRISGCLGFIEHPVGNLTALPSHKEKD